MEKEDTRAKGPHQAVIIIKAEIMDNLPTGEVSGIPRAIEKKIISIQGLNFADCAEKVNKFIESIKYES